MPVYIRLNCKCKIYTDKTKELKEDEERVSLALESYEVKDGSILKGAQ